MTNATNNYQMAGNNAQQGINTLLGADTRNQFTAAKAAMDRTATPIAGMGQSAQLATQGVGLLSQGAQGLTEAQDQANKYAQANLVSSNDALKQGITSLGGAAGMYNPTGVQNFMNPYQQQVIDESIKQINRQGAIAQQNLQGQAVRVGAFGGSRDAIQRAELDRNLASQRDAAIVGGLSTGYQNAAQQAQQAFEAQQGRQLAQAQGYQNLGGTMGQQALQQAQLGQGSASIQGNLANQQAGIAGLYGNVAGQQSNIYNQQATANMNLGQGIGSLAQQQFGIGQNMAQGLGSLSAQQGNLATQGAALGQATQGLGQQDTNFLYNLGTSQQRQLQSEVDATRQNELTQNMQPYQQLGFLSDIYRGAPSSQMSVTTQSQATPSPFMQAAGLGIAATSAAAAAGRAGII
jgi:hypothetical protein